MRVVGTVQDGGLPHVACTCERCDLARRDPGRRRLVASLAIVLPDSGRTLLIDATPDVREQLDALADVRHPPAGRVDRAPLDGVLLTHGHMGHYTGLSFFGFEAVHTRGMPLFATSSMAAYLSTHGPWSQLVELGNVDLREIRPGEPFELGDGVRATAIAAPHRDEFTDTVGFLVEGARASVFYLPDTDSWEAWEPPVERVLERADVALLDGSFYSLEELPGRAVESIGHPLIAGSMDRFQPLVGAGKQIFFIHLNHSNPALGPGEVVLEGIEARGFGVAREGQEFPL